MLDRFENWSPALDAPATHAFVITPSDDTDLPEMTRALYVGGAGDLSVILKSGDAVTFANVSASFILPAQIGRVKASGTTATAIVGLS